MGDAQSVTSVAIQHTLDRLEEVAERDHPDPRATLYRVHLEALLCAARLREAIARAERWYAQREDDLHHFDQRATATVRQLVSESRVRPSLAWPSP
jgi:hypothetical protein